MSTINMLFESVIRSFRYIVAGIAGAAVSLSIRADDTLFVWGAIGFAFIVGLVVEVLLYRVESELED